MGKIISFLNLTIVIAEDCPTYGPAAQKELKKVCPNATVKLFCDYTSANNFLEGQTKVDVVICDIALRETDVEDIKQNLGAKLLFDLSVDRNNISLIAWTQLSDEKLALSLRKRLIRVVGKHLDLDGLVKELRQIIDEKFKNPQN